MSREPIDYKFDIGHSLRVDLDRNGAGLRYSRQRGPAQSCAADFTETLQATDIVTTTYFLRVGILLCRIGHSLQKLNWLKRGR
jgi:hypothetical protein